MFVPYTPLTTCSTTPQTRALHSVLTVLLVGFMLIILAVADPHQRHALALINDAGQWLHAVFPQLIK